LAYRDASGFHPTVHGDDPATHIAKFNRDDDLPTLVLNENSTLQLGREVLGDAEVTRAHIGQLRGFDGVSLLVERFDRNAGRRLRLEDFAQVLNKPRGRDFSGKYQSSYEEAAQAITSHSARPKVDLLRYFRLVVFNLVVGNADAHLKNFSLLEQPDGLRLSPAYDLVNTIVYPEYDRVAALEINGRRRPFDQINRALVEQLGLDIGLSKKTVEQSLDNLAKRFASAQTLTLSNNVQPHEFRARYRDIIADNAERVLT
jgi:serine/threonine-protein kinase HipA